MKRLVLILMTVMLLAPGCGLLGKKSEKTAAELAAEGRQAYSDGDFRDALSSYQKIRDWYPFSPYATEAELRIADAHFELEEYAEAAVSYAEFERLHPTHEDAARVAYQSGMTYFRRISTVDRDTTPARDALYLFRRLVRSYPDSPFAEQGRLRIQECLDQLAASELSIADFYTRTERYKAARARLETLLATYPDTRVADDARILLEKVRTFLPPEAVMAEKAESMVPAAN